LTEPSKNDYLDDKMTEHNTFVRPVSKSDPNII
jgi:hypothetical protein